MSPHVLIAEDDHNLQQGLLDLLEAEGYRVTTADDGQQAFDAFLSDAFDLLLLDVMMPELSGYDVCREVRKLNTTVPIIMLTAKGEEIDKVVGLELGADDYIPKPFNHRELLARVKAITRRIEHINSVSNNTNKKLSLNGITINFAAREASINNIPLTLTGTEYEILALLIKHAPDVITKEQISEDVLGRRLASFDRSIDMHVSNIRKKIAEHIEGDKIKTMRGAGYVFIQGE